MYSFRAVIASEPKNVFARYPVFSVTIVNMIRFSFQFSKIMSQFKFMRSVTRSPVSFNAMTNALNVDLFCGLAFSSILIISGVVARLAPLGVLLG